MKKKLGAVLLAVVLVLTLGLVMAAPVGANPDPGLVGLWHFDEGTGATASDSSGNGNNGTVYGAGWVSDQWGGSALSFNGTGYVEVPDNTTLKPAAITVEAWVKATSPGTYKYIVSKVYVARAGSYSSYALYTAGSGGLRFYIGHATGWVGSPDAGSALWDGNWHHVAGTYDGSYVRLYIDGSQVGTGTATTASIAYDAGKLFIGAYDASATYSWVRFPGTIDEVRIWDTATPSFNLTATPEIDFNPVNTDHTVTATVTIDKVGGGTEVAPGVLVDFDVTGINSDSDDMYTQSNGEATFAYTGTSDGEDTIDISIGNDFIPGDSVTVTKYWLENFVTGGGNYKEGKTLKYTFAGTVGNLEGGSVGQFQIVDHANKTSYHCNNNFSSLVFSDSDAPAESPVASHDTATFTGTFTNNRNANLTVITVIIEDLGEPGAKVDTIAISGGLTITETVISGGNFQVHGGLPSNGDGR